MKAICRSVFAPLRHVAVPAGHTSLMQKRISEKSVHLVAFTPPDRSMGMRNAFLVVI